MRDLCNKYSIPSASQLSKWIRKFVSEEQKELLMGKSTSTEESSELARLRKELKETQLALYQARMKADAYNTMIDVAEEMFKIPIRKKANTKQ